MNNTTFIHPEIRHLVIKEYQRMKKNNPKADGGLMWEMARDYVFAISVADTQAFKISYF